MTKPSSASRNTSTPPRTTSAASIRGTGPLVGDYWPRRSTKARARAANSGPGNQPQMALRLEVDEVAQKTFAPRPPGGP